jgi:ribonuclease R
MTNNGQNRPRDEEEARKLGEELKQSPLCPDEPTLVQIGQRCNQTEQNAEGAEHELRAFLVLQLLEKHIGEDFNGMVTGVTSNGVFVQLEKYLADGLVKVDTLVPHGLRPGQWPQWAIDKRSGALVERHTGRSYNIGDKVTVTVSEVDLARRQMELVIADTAGRESGKVKKVTDRLTLGGGMGGGLGHVDDGERRTGADKRAARSKGRERGKSDFRGKRKEKGKGF